MAVKTIDGCMFCGWHVLICVVVMHVLLMLYTSEHCGWCAELYWSCARKLGCISAVAVSVLSGELGDHGSISASVCVLEL